MTFDEYQDFDAIGLGGLVAKREVEPRELLDAAVARAQEVNPRINAIVRDLETEARQAIDAGLPAGPLRGVPFLLKDSNAQMRGVPTTSGSRVFRDSLPEADCALVSAYRGAGLVILGKTNTPEMETNCATEPVLFGATRNPWDLTRIPGGSSGGSAAAVAAGITPAAHASDAGGSIRIPAACCGLFGLKPSRGRVSTAPRPEGWGGLAVEHALTRSVRDSALLLDIACRPQPGDPYWLEPPAVPFHRLLDRPPGQLRIAFTTGGLLAEAIHPACVKAVRDAAALCQSLGHDVEECAPAADFGGLAAVVGALVTPAVAGVLDQEAERRGRPIQPEEVEASTWNTYVQGAAVSALDRERATHVINRFARQMAVFFERYDVLLLSTLGGPPLPVGTLNADGEDLEGFAAQLFAFACNTLPFNVTGQPGMSVPLSCTDEGLPLGAQFVARQGADGLLFQLAAQLEAAQPWAGRRPSL
jgi:amidase